MKKSIPTFSAALALLLVMPCASGAALSPSDWAQWRGPTRDGHLATSREWPDRLGTNELRKTWTVSLDKSYSGPLIVGDLVITTETVDEKTERVSAYDRANGDLRWERSWRGSMKVPFFAASNGSWIRSTPASDGEFVFVLGMRDVLVAVRLDNGEEVWRVDFVEQLETPLPSFGGVCSPLVDGDFVLVQAGAGFCKLDKRTGKIVWRTATDKGGMFGSAFSSPIAVRLAGKELYLVQAREALHGISRESGGVVFSQPIKAFRGMNIQTPLVVGDRIFTSSYGGRSQMWGFDSSEGEMAVREIWNTKHQGYMTSPVLVGDVIYNHLRNQRLVALDTASGADLWNVSNRFGKYISFVVNGKKILALDQKGELFLFEASRERFRKIGSAKVADDCWAHLAVSDDDVVVRQLTALTMYRWKGRSMADGE